jgi:hypothetical protein
MPFTELVLWCLGYEMEKCVSIMFKVAIFAFFSISSVMSFKRFIGVFKYALCCVSPRALLVTWIPSN